MLDLKQTLVNLKGFEDNEFLDQYCTLIERHTRTSKRARVTNAHHIIPKSWFKINNQEIDNSLINLVNLPYREHVLAHYYLCLCTVGKLQYANQLAFFCLITRKKKLNIVEKQLVHNLPMYNNIYESYCRNSKISYSRYTED